MTLSDELTRLADLRERGALTEEEYARAKTRLLDAPPALTALNTLRRSRTDRWVAGVCGGIARATGIESWVLRLVMTVLVLWGGVGLVVYLLAWIFVPAEPETPQLRESARH